MMHVFDLRHRVVKQYGSFTRSFLQIRDSRIEQFVQEALQAGFLWPEPLIQLNPAFEPGETIDELVDAGTLHDECRRIFRVDKDEIAHGHPMRLYRHQAEAIKLAPTGVPFVLTTGTGSGKSLAYIVPIVDHVLRNGSGRGIRAIVVYPMNALANSQVGELEKFLCRGYPQGQPPVTFARYTGQESREEKQRIIGSPPDILLTNYVMLELILTRPDEQPLVRQAQGLQCLVLDEMHTYRGRQGADVAMLVRRAREAFAAADLQCIATSATVAGPGSLDEQQREVARVASLLFGVTVQPEHVIGETLRRRTKERDPADKAFREALRRSIEEGPDGIPREYDRFLTCPLAAWVETTFGIARESDGGRLVRAQPRPIEGPQGAAGELADLTGLEPARCADAIRQTLLTGSAIPPRPGERFAPFAFRVHQFVSRGENVYASVEPADARVLSLHPQRFAPGDRTRRLLPLVFCRECGQEYYSVHRVLADDQAGYQPRDWRARPGDDDAEAAYLAINEQDLWPTDPDKVIERLPEDWIDERGRVISSRRDRLPRPVRVTPDGREGKTGVDAILVPAPFPFCLRCGVAYSLRHRRDFMKLSSLDTGGRSTATTVLCLSAIEYLRADQAALPSEARKLLSFTDNRQDASLQAGHFNDFIQVGQLRGALYRAVTAAGDRGMTHEELGQRVFANLGLPFEHYAADPSVKYAAQEDTERTMRDVLAYRLYRDLERGWRVTAPNLEQCGLLEIRYRSLEELCRDEAGWRDRHPALAGADPSTRQQVARYLLDYLRRELAIHVDYLDPSYLERLERRSSQHLVPPWGLDENEPLEPSRIAFVASRSRQVRDSRAILLSPRGGFGQLLRRRGTFPNHDRRLRVDESAQIMEQLLGTLRTAGLVSVASEVVVDGQRRLGYQVAASGMTWHAGDGTRPAHDPIRVPRLPDTGARTNPFFVEFYKRAASALTGLEAREHTAQVDYEDRRQREERFRKGHLPVLYCSPTMELGVDIAELNVVNMRNVPPTPANYAQRSGRAGRGGQPAFVFTYCSTGSSHDQFFFKRPELMVAGSVTPPRIDLANEDLLRAHIHAIWLAQANLSLGSSLRDLLDLDGDPPSLELRPHVRERLDDQVARERTRDIARRILQICQADLDAVDWYHDGWLDEVISQIPAHFEAACARWRELYRSAWQQAQSQHRIALDHARPRVERDRAERLRREARAQLELLMEADHPLQSDFYSYRYFASEGFLPGYNFPRLPLSAFVPARRRRRTDRDEFISRPRFLAISEFGPRAHLYHEGIRYIINRVILPVAEHDQIATSQVKICLGCGYLHPMVAEVGLDVCARCGRALGQPLSNLMRLANVSTRRRDRINSDEEERVRMGYEIRSGIRFADRHGQPHARRAEVVSGGEQLALLTYGHAATIWRMNLGWRRRRPGELGFILDIERGYWARRQDDDVDDQDDPMSRRQQRVIPYVEDRRNALLFEPSQALDPARMASLQAALKTAIETLYQLEETELAAEPLPASDDRRLILFYEAAEGGAGILRRLVDDRDGLSRVARQALEIAHFDPDTGADRRRAPRAREDCTAACYDCLMSYMNQPDHELLDRHLVRDLLRQLAAAEVHASPVGLDRDAHFDQLQRQCESGLERRWLIFAHERALRLPSRAQAFIDEAGARVDFIYDDERAAVFIDGPVHSLDDIARRDREQEARLENLGYAVIRFGHEDDWEATARRYPSIFGSLA
ncbi:MAG: DEAD/DEAH box helicase [Bacteroidetes bacterium]|nr:MAG: DEAD/DEAH box helicase [Bacteroidota bacterium]